MRPYFALLPVRAEDVGAEGRFGAGTQVYPLLTTCPMGWSHAVAVAQAAHERFIKEDVGLSARDMISRTGDLTVDRPRWSVYIDDFTVVSTDQRSADRMLPRPTRRCGRAVTASRFSASFSTDGAEPSGCHLPSANG